MKSAKLTSVSRRKCQKCSASSPTLPSPPTRQDQSLPLSKNINIVTSQVPNLTTDYLYLSNQTIHHQSFIRTLPYLSNLIGSIKLFSCSDFTITSTFFSISSIPSISSECRSFKKEGIDLRSLIKSSLL